MTKLNWREAVAPNLEVFEALAREAFDSLPEEFRALCGDILFIIDDFPDEDVMKEMELQSEFDILGLYSGVSARHQDSLAVPQGPNTVHLYRRPILDYWAEHHETLGDIVRHVLIHEIGHHVGLSDEDMHAIEDAAD